MFKKPTDTHQHLHKTSCHPCHTKKAIPYSQALRLRLICSEDHELDARLRGLAGWLEDRGYEESFIKEQIGEASRKDRETLICNSNKTSKENGLVRVPLVTSYHPVLNSIGTVAQRLHSMFRVPEENKRMFLTHHLFPLSGARTLGIFW